MQTITDKLLNWASVIDQGTIDQALKASRMQIVTGHVALMPDAHVGIGATVGSVIPTENAIIPAAVGVDIGCGMIAVETDLTASQLPDNLGPYMPKVEEAVPAGLGKWHDRATDAAQTWFAAHHPKRPLDNALEKKALEQFGTLGSGNHFFEVCLDERDIVWIVLHSGSRGVGNVLASRHIDIARNIFRHADDMLEDPDLAFFVNGTDQFQAYVDDLLWAQDYAAANRNQMMNSAIKAFFKFVGKGKEAQRINCHHNFTQREDHNGKKLWITRKGAIQADTGRLGVIPGSMGTRSYIVEGLGNPLSYNSCSHGAGRAMSRGEARRTFTAKDLREQMGDRVWQDRVADELIDEIPSSYKDIDVVMEDQKDLVSVVHTLHQILNYKGTDGGRSKKRGKTYKYDANKGKFIGASPKGK
jgi:RNA-splicing ligase RtcB